MRKADLDALNRTPDAILGMLPGATRRGAVYWATCPIHSEKSASVQVSKRSRGWRWKCFGCGKGGDAVDLKRETAGLGFRDACRALGVEDVDDERPPATEAELDAYRQRMMDTMPLPLPPWATDDFAILHCDCGSTILNRPRSPARFRRESLQCPACVLNFPKALDEIGPPRVAGLFGSPDEGWRRAFVAAVGECIRGQSAR